MEGNFNTSFGRIEGLAKNFGAGILRGLVGGLSVGAIAAFGKSVIELGDQLSDLSDQTGLSIAVLGGIKPVLDASNSSLDGFAKGIAKAQRSLGDFRGAGKEAAEAFRSIGLDPAQLVNLAPDQFLEKLVAGLAKVQNANERAAIAFRILGKSAAETIPAILQMAENGIPKLDNATAQAYKRLGDLKDQMVQLGAAVTNFAAPPIAGLIDLLKILGALKISPLESLQKSTKEAREEIDKIDATLRRRQQLRGAGLGFLTAPESDDARLIDEKSRALDKFIDLNSKLIQQERPKPTAANFKGLLPSSTEINKVKNEVDNFLDGLSKQIDTINAKKIELRFGTDAGLGASLDAQLERFKDNLRDKQLPIPKGLEEFFKSLKERILAGNDELRKMQHELQKLDEIGKAFSQDSAEFLNVDQDLAKVGEDRTKQLQELNDLRAKLRLGAMDTSTPEGRENQRVQGILAEAAQASEQIREMGRAIGLSMEQQATDAELVWAEAFQKIGQKADETTEFTRRAMERAFDAGADLFKDALGGQIKTWEDFGLRVKKVIDEIAAEWLTLQLKTLVLGPDFGKTGAGGLQLGGLLGQLLGSSGTTPITGRPPGVEGPLMANGSFGGTSSAASAGGGILSLLGSFAKFFGFHEGGLITRGGEYASFKVAPRMHSGGEVPVMAQSGEYMMSRWSAASIGKNNLDTMNRTGMMPAAPRAGNSTNHFHFPNAQFADRRSTAQVGATLGRAVKAANRNL